MLSFMHTGMAATMPKTWLSIIIAKLIIPTCRQSRVNAHQLSTMPHAGASLPKSGSAVLALPYRWVQGECSSLGDMDAPEVDPRLHRAAQALRQRQVLFRYCAEEVATARHNAMFQR